MCTPGKHLHTCCGDLPCCTQGHLSHEIAGWEAVVVEDTEAVVVVEGMEAVVMGKGALRVVMGKEVLRVVMVKEALAGLEVTWEEEDTEVEVAIMVEPLQGIPSRVDTRYVMSCKQQSHNVCMKWPTQKPLDIAHSGTLSARHSASLGRSMHAQYQSSRASSNCQSTQNVFSYHCSASTYCIEVTAFGKSNL